MNKKKGIALILGAFAVSIFLWNSVTAQTTPTDPQISNDAIGVRIVPNPNHYSIYRWYENQGFKGSPQPLIIDGYEALRDGRTVYVNAANIDVNSKRIFTNIYLISYNQDPSAKTVDILGQIISHWKFNDNLPPEVSTCSISAVKCLTNNDCSADQECSTSNSTCVLKTEKNCQVDTDCPANFFCNSLKAKVIRDIKRIGRLEEVREGLVRYREANGTYPILSGGTYLPGKSISVWPSWNEVLMPTIGIKQSVVDPVNRLGICPLSYDAKTCWNNSTKAFVYQPVGATLQLPRDSYALVYSTNNSGSEYNLCAVMETRDSSNPNLAYSFDPNPPTLSNCVTAIGILASGNATNSAPVIHDVQLRGITGREYNGYIRAEDADGDPLSWRLETSGSTWANWSAAPVLRMTSDEKQRRIFAEQAGSVGNYNIRITVSDNKGASTATTSVIQITSPTGYNQTVDYEYRLDPVNPFNYTFTSSGSIAPTPQIISGRNILTMTGITRTVSSEGANRQRVNYLGVINTTTNRFTEDTETVYRLNNGGVTNNFVIRVKVDKPVINIDCPTQSRVGSPYNCLIGSTRQGSHTINFTSSPQIPGLSLRAGINDPENIYLTGTTTTANTGQAITIAATNEYGTVSTASLNLRVNTFCGDGILNFNTEGRGGVYNDGNESCDGIGNIAQSVETSSVARQYACNTTGPTPYPLSGHSYCIFKSPLDGGGYCGDTYCQTLKSDGTLLETVSNCRQDCDPEYSYQNLAVVLPDTTPILPNQGEGGASSCAYTGFGCEAGYRCNSAGVCERLCWQKPETTSLITVHEGDALSATSCAVTPRDNPDCTSDDPIRYPCPSACTSRGPVTSYTDDNDECSIYHGPLNGDDWYPRAIYTCRRDEVVSRCYQDQCRTTGSATLNGRMDENGNCIVPTSTPVNPPTGGTITCDSELNNSCPSGMYCQGASGHCAGGSGCSGNSEYNCPGAQGGCNWVVDNIGTCVSSNQLPPPPSSPTSPIVTPCTPGNYVFSDAGACTTCPRGYYCPDGTIARTCEEGTYTRDTGNSVCDPCDAGSYCVGRASIIGCAAGTYRSSTGGESQSDCTNCAAGTYTDDTGNTQCDPCPAGTYNTTERQTSCTQCPAGSYCTGRTNRTPCPANYYRSSTGGRSLSDCSRCPTGYVSPQGSDSSSDCRLAGSGN